MPEASRPVWCDEITKGLRSLWPASAIQDPTVDLLYNVRFCTLDVHRETIFVGVLLAHLAEIMTEFRWQDLHHRSSIACTPHICHLNFIALFLCVSLFGRCILECLENLTAMNSCKHCKHPASSAVHFCFRKQHDSAVGQEGHHRCSCSASPTVLTAHEIQKCKECTSSV